MKLVCVLSFLLILSCLSNSAFQADAYHHFVFALQWPPSLCELQPSTARCINRPIENFTIHGLWPVYEDGGPVDVPLQNCSDSLSWMNETNSPLVQQLNIYWANFQYNENKEFWKHEWRTHGCMQGFFPPQEYFQRALSIRTAVGSIVNTLASLDVRPSVSTYYNVTYFAEALKLRTGMDRVVLTCIQRLLLEVRICVNRNADQFINCNEVEMTRSCDLRTLVRLLPKSASRYGGGIIKALKKTSDVGMYMGI